jgi:hypothetical protein
MHKHILARSVGLALLASGLLAGCGDKDGAQQAMGEMPPAAVDVVTLHTAPCNCCPSSPAAPPPCGWPRCVPR